MIFGSGVSLCAGDADVEAEVEPLASLLVEELGTARDEDTLLLDTELEEEEEATAPRLSDTVLSLPFAIEDDAIGVAVDLNEEIVRKGGGPSPFPMLDAGFIDEVEGT